MEKSEKLGLWLPEDTDPLEISKLSENFEKLDDFAKDAGGGGDVSALVKSMKVGDITYSTRNLEEESGGVLIACDQRVVDRNAYPNISSLYKYRLMKIPHETIFAESVSELPGDLHRLANTVSAKGGLFGGTIPHIISWSRSSATSMTLVKRDRHTFQTISSKSIDLNGTTATDYKLQKEIRLGNYIYTFGSVLAKAHTTDNLTVVDIEAGTSRKVTNYISISSTSFKGYPAGMYMKNGSGCITYRTNNDPHMMFVWTDNNFETVGLGAVSIPGGYTLHATGNSYSDKIFGACSYEKPFASLIQANSSGHLFRPSIASDLDGVDKVIVFRSTDYGKTWSSYYITDALLGQSSPSTDITAFGIVEDTIYLLLTSGTVGEELYALSSKNSSRIYKKSFSGVSSGFSMSARNGGGQAMIFYSDKNLYYEGEYCYGAKYGGSAAIESLIRIDLTTGNRSICLLPKYFVDSATSSRRGIDYSYVRSIDGDKIITLDSLGSYSNSNAFPCSVYDKEVGCIKTNTSDLIIGSHHTFVNRDEILNRRYSTSGTAVFGSDEGDIYVIYISSNLHTDESGSTAFLTIKHYLSSKIALPYIQNAYIKAIDDTTETVEEAT